MDRPETVAQAPAGAPVLGAAPEAWRLEALAAPLAVGWVAQALVAAWSHLLPAVGPGGPAEHAAQRVVLGRLATGRLLLLNVGTVLLGVGLATVDDAAGPPSALAAAGAALVAAALGASVALLALAVLRARPARRLATG